jgi:hypothetical protein
MRLSSAGVSVIEILNDDHTKAGCARHAVRLWAASATAFSQRSYGHGSVRFLRAQSEMTSD